MMIGSNIQKHTMKFESLEAECKWYEKNFSPDQMIPLLPVIIRLDGNGFSKWSQKLQKPFDIGFNRCFDAITKDLVNETGAVIGIPLELYKLKEGEYPLFLSNYNCVPPYKFPKIVL